MHKPVSALAPLGMRLACLSTVRMEKDSFGEIAVPAERLYGAQTVRSLHHFKIGQDPMPRELIVALLQVKRASAVANRDLGVLSARKANAIVAAADDLLQGRVDIQSEFPLSVFQTGSGTQTNMNANEVLANLASEAHLGGKRGESRLVHPNDDVNHGTSSNDVFPTAMHVAATTVLHQRVLPSLKRLRDTLHGKSEKYMDLIKIGRTHLQDATPLSVGQEFSAWVAQLDMAHRAITASLGPLSELALGGTAVGTGLNAHPKLGEMVARELSSHLDTLFVSAPNKFAALAGHDALVGAHGALKQLATALMKLANDVRFLSSGPRSGLGELLIPENEPGSSIMPGKVNPTQGEQMAMVCAQVMGNDVVVSIAGSAGNFQLNVMKPLIAYNMLHSANLLADSMDAFDEHCARGIRPNEARIAHLVSQSLMLVTALVPQIGYDKAAKISKHAHEHHRTLREAALELGLVSAADFDRAMSPDGLRAMANLNDRKST